MYVEVAITECNDKEGRTGERRRRSTPEGKGMTMDHDETRSLISGTDPESLLIGRVS